MATKYDWIERYDRIKYENDMLRLINTDYDRYKDSVFRLKIMLNEMQFKTKEAKLLKDRVRELLEV